MKNKLWIFTVVLFLLPASLLAQAQKQHGGFLFRFIGAGGGGASVELKSSDGIVRERQSQLAHDYRFDFGYSITQSFALHIGVWGRSILDGQNRPLQQVTGIPIGMTFFLPNNWYISPVFIYNVRRSDREAIGSTIRGAADQAGQAARSAALVGGVAGATTSTTTGLVTAVMTAGGTITAQQAAPLVIGALSAGGALAVAGASQAQVDGAIQGILQQGILQQEGITDAAYAAQLAAGTAAVRGGVNGIVTGATTAQTTAQQSVLAANSSLVDSNGYAVTSLGFQPSGYSYGLDIGWENPANDDWGVGFGIRYWRVFTEAALAFQIPSGQNTFATRTINFRAREDLFGFTLSATLN